MAPLINAVVLTTLLPHLFLIQPSSCEDIAAGLNIIPFLDTSQAATTISNTITTDDPWQQPSQKTWRLFIMYQTGLNTLKLALNGFQFSSKVMLANLIIIDNSDAKEAVHDRDINMIVHEVVATPTRRNFAQLQNLIADMALHRGLEFYFWAHSDNYPLAKTAESDFDTDVFRCLHEQVQRDKDWGVIYFAYDHLVAFRVMTMVQVPWDPNVYQYGLKSQTYPLLTFILLFPECGARSTERLNPVDP